MSGLIALACYQFTALEDPEDVRAALAGLCGDAGLVGTLIVAAEGINGTVAGTRGAIDALYRWFAADPRFAGVEAKESPCAVLPFRRLKVVCKSEIVTLRDPQARPTERTGERVAAEDWNRVLADPDTVVLDCRNSFEVRVGTFEGAIDPGTRSFTEFPDFVAKHLDPNKHAKVAMFCTGGIRCEKASSLLLARGFASVQQLDGGILRYLETVDEAESRWRGECFVFDRRVSLRHGLREGTFEECRGCKAPVSAEDREHPHFERDVSCPACYASLTPARRAGLRERSRQVQLAELRGGEHLAGTDPRGVRSEDPESIRSFH